jgi:hypothetical protein
MCRPQYTVSVVFQQKLRQVLVSLYILLHQIFAAKGQGLKTLTSGQTGSKRQDVSEHFERREVAPVASRCQVCSSVFMPKRSRGRHDLRFSSLFSSPWNFKVAKKAITSCSTTAKEIHMATVFRSRRQPADGHYTNTPALQEFQLMTLLLGDGTVRM